MIVQEKNVYVRGSADRGSVGIDERGCVCESYKGVCVSEGDSV